MSYFVKHQELESAAEVLRSDASYADSANLDMSAIGKLPPPAAGEGVGAALATLQKNWTELLPRLSKEITGLADRTNASATLYVEVEQQTGNRFAAFAQ